VRKRESEMKEKGPAREWSEIGSQSEKRISAAKPDIVAGITIFHRTMKD